MFVSLYEWVMFTAVLISAMIIPGPGVFATVAYSLSVGFRRAIFFVLGAALADLTFLWIALLGLGIFFETASYLLILALLLAAIYFAHMSFKLLRAFLTAKKSSGTIQVSRSMANNPLTILLSGYSITITNPKVIVFYLAILPVFLQVEDFGKYDYLIVSLITPLSLICVLGSYAYATSLAKTLLSSETFGKTVNLITAIIFGLVSLVLFIRLGGLFVSLLGQ